MTADPCMFEISVRKEGVPDRHFPLHEGTFAVGRSGACEICIPVSSISRKHAAVTLREDTVWVEDLDSLNGTYINGTRIAEPTRLTPGEVVSLGELELRLQVAGQGDEPIPEAWLQVISTGLKGLNIVVPPPSAIIGRSHTADVQLNHPTVSRAHTLLRYSTDNKAWMIEDMSSSNRTYLDEVPVSQSVLEGGERIRVGDVDTVFHLGAEPQPLRNYGILALLVVLLGASIVLLLSSLFSSALD
jgi:pSer/pThr/pTyr-binding forkhead associated (FHA) protein